MMEEPVDNTDENKATEEKNGSFKSVLQWAKENLRKLHWFWYKKFPGLIHDPYYDLKCYREHDEQKNADTYPSQNEESSLLCLWAVEFYTPSNINNLRKAFNKLGWNTKDSINYDNDMVSWLDLRRNEHHGGSWAHLGVLKNPDDKRLFVRKRSIPLPSNVDFATAQIFHLTSSLTCLVTCFVLKENAAGIFDDALKARYQTYTQRLKPNGYRILDPESQKRMRIQEIRQELRASIAHWYNSHFPGVFTSKNQNTDIPTCELIILKDDPYSSDEKTYSTYIRLLDLQHEIGCWESLKLEGLRFLSSLARFENKTINHMALVISQNHLQALDMERYGGHSRETYVTKFNTNFIPPFLTKWACSVLLCFMESELHLIRDSNIIYSSRTKPEILLKELRKTMINSIDIAAICPELINLSNSRYFKPETCNFVHKKLPGDTKKPNHLIENLAKNIAYRAKQLQAADNAIKDLLIQKGNIISATENIRLQNFMGCLTVIILILTAATVVLAWLALKQSKL